MSVVAKSYVSPTLVLLAFDWAGRAGQEGFPRFAIERTPGFNGAATSWLPNRIGFDGPVQNQPDIPTNVAPIQKFYWWDARIDDKDRGATFAYRITPVAGSPTSLKLLDDQAATIQVTVPQTEENGIGSYFNRAVVSSQAFSKQFPKLDTDDQRRAAEAWLANGLEQAVPQFLDRASGRNIEGAIYHLTDENWIIPALSAFEGDLSLVYNQTKDDHTSDAAIAELVKAGKPDQNFAARTHANIMHNKFLVRVAATGR